LHAQVQRFESVFSCRSEVGCGFEEVRFAEETLECKVVFEVLGVSGLVVV
jgi:hypothetical protein